MVKVGKKLVKEGKVLERENGYSKSNDGFAARYVLTVVYFTGLAGRPRSKSLIQSSGVAQCPEDGHLTFETGH